MKDKVIKRRLWIVEEPIGIVRSQQPGMMVLMSDIEARAAKAEFPQLIVRLVTQEDRMAHYMLNMSEDQLETVMASIQGQLSKEQENEFYELVKAQPSFGSMPTSRGI